jgi:hypothetical protein
MQKEIDNVLIFRSGDKRRVYRVLFTYHSESLSKDFAVFYNEEDENDLVGFSYDENKVLSELQSSEEFSELERALREFDSK